MSAPPVLPEARVSPRISPPTFSPGRLPDKHDRTCSDKAGADAHPVADPDADEDTGPGGDAGASADVDPDADADADSDVDADGEVDDEVEGAGNRVIQANPVAADQPAAESDAIANSGVEVEMDDRALTPAGDTTYADVGNVAEGEYSDADAEGEPDSDFLPEPPPLPSLHASASTEAPVPQTGCSHSPAASGEGTHLSQAPSQGAPSPSRSPSMPHSFSTPSSAPLDACASHFPPTPPKLSQSIPIPQSRTRRNSSTSASKRSRKKRKLDPGTPLEAGQLWSERNSTLPRRKPLVTCAYCHKRAKGLIRQQLVAVMPDGRLVPHFRADEEPEDEVEVQREQTNRLPEAPGKIFDHGIHSSPSPSLLPPHAAAGPIPTRPNSLTDITSTDDSPSHDFSSSVPRPPQGEPMIADDSANNAVSDSPTTHNPCSRPLDSSLTRFFPGAERMQVVPVPEDLESCHLCGSSGHASCLSWKEQACWKVDIVRAYPWTCADCKRCEVCAGKPKSEDEEATFLFCSRCDRAWHTHCIGLTDVPPGWWNCPTCVAQGIEGPPDPMATTFVLRSPSPPANRKARRGSSSSGDLKRSKSNGGPSRGSALGRGRGRGRAARSTRSRSTNPSNPSDLQEINETDEEIASTVPPLGLEQHGPRFHSDEAAHSPPTQRSLSPEIEQGPNPCVHCDEHARQPYSHASHSPEAERNYLSSGQRSPGPTDQQHEIVPHAPHMLHSAGAFNPASSHPPLSSVRTSEQGLIFAFNGLHMLPKEDVTSGEEDVTPIDHVPALPPHSTLHPPILSSPYTPHAAAEGCTPRPWAIHERPDQELSVIGHESPSQSPHNRHSPYHYVSEHRLPFQPAHPQYPHESYGPPPPPLPPPAPTPVPALAPVLTPPPPTPPPPPPAPAPPSAPALSPARFPTLLHDPSYSEEPSLALASAGTTIAPNHAPPLEAVPPESHTTELPTTTAATTPDLKPIPAPSHVPSHSPSPKPTEALTPVSGHAPGWRLAPEPPLATAPVFASEPTPVSSSVFVSAPAPPPALANETVHRPTPAPDAEPKSALAAEHDVEHKSGLDLEKPAGMTPHMPQVELRSNSEPDPKSDHNLDHNSHAGRPYESGHDSQAESASELGHDSHDAPDRGPDQEAGHRFEIECGAEGASVAEHDAEPDVQAAEAAFGRSRKSTQGRQDTRGSRRRREPRKQASPSPQPLDRGRRRIQVLPSFPVRAGDFPPIAGPNPFDGILTPAQADMSLTWPGAEDRALFAESSLPQASNQRPQSNGHKGPAAGSDAPGDFQEAACVDGLDGHTSANGFRGRGSAGNEVYADGEAGASGVADAPKNTESASLASITGSSIAEPTPPSPELATVAAAATGAGPLGLQPVSRIRFDGIEISTWFSAPLPDELSLVPEGIMYVCGQCFKFLTSSMMACRHRLKCKYARPHGKLIYAHDKVRIYEVDGATNKVRTSTSSPICLSLFIPVFSFS